MLYSDTLVGVDIKASRFYIYIYIYIQVIMNVQTRMCAHNFLCVEDTTLTCCSFVSIPHLTYPYCDGINPHCCDLGNVGTTPLLKIEQVVI